MTEVEISARPRHITISRALYAARAGGILGFSGSPGDPGRSTPAKRAKIRP